MRVGAGVSVEVGVAVGGMGVAVGGIGVELGGTGVLVAGGGVLVGGLGVYVDVRTTGVGSAVGDNSTPQPASARLADTATNQARLRRRWRRPLQ